MDPDGELSFLSEGTELAGFRRDIYGRKKVADLKYNAKLGMTNLQRHRNRCMSICLINLR